MDLSFFPSTLFLLELCKELYSTPIPKSNQKVCIGTSIRLSVPADRRLHYQSMRERYTNCTYVDGNLEVTWFDEPDADLSFLQHIREVTGFVLIARVNIERLALPNLQIIRGRTVFQLNRVRDSFSFMLMYSRIRILEMPALRDILAGNIGLVSNNGLCYLDTIRWAEILTGPAARVVSLHNRPGRSCTPCHSTCRPESGCWGPEPHHCQHLSKINCSPQCHGGRCFGPKPRQCCHLFCAGGCTGPTQSDCLACRNFYDDGVCKQECPSMLRYNQITYAWENNPNGKYAYGATCVKQCPSHLLRDSSACVRSCPDRKRPVNGECQLCDGPCPRTCHLAEGEVIHSDNVDRLANCSMLHGSLVILEHTFVGFHEFIDNKPGPYHQPMHPNRLEVLSSLREVSGFVRIEASNTEFVNLNFLRNLEYVSGRVRSEGMALYIVKTSLRSLGLMSLKKLRFGSVTVTKNPNLCLADSIDWKSLVAQKSTTNRSFDITVTDNKPRRVCVAEGAICHEQCTLAGCWGKGAENCVQCRHFRIEKKCIESCKDHPGVYQVDNSTCSKCDEQCKDGCKGAGPKQCTRCRHFVDNSTCVARCPKNKYDHLPAEQTMALHSKPISSPVSVRLRYREVYLSGNQVNPASKSPLSVFDNGETGKIVDNDSRTLPDAVSECRECHESCVGGCTGASNKLGSGGCNSCHNAVLDDKANTTWCLAVNETCPRGHYMEFSGAQHYDPEALVSGVCKKCHSFCKQCTGFGFHVSVCLQCVHYQSGEQCVAECGDNFYIDQEHKQCLPCHPECNGCYGPGQSCKACKNFKIHLAAGLDIADSTDGNYTAPVQFNCTSDCPDSHPHRLLPENGDDRLCSAQATPLAVHVTEETVTMVTAVSVAAATLTIIAALAVACKCLSDRKKRDMLKMTMLMSKDGLLSEPLKLTDVRPNLAKLRVVKEVELRRGGILGYGAFGTVYKGVWLPEGEHVKIPVAIKVLREGSGVDTNKDILEEAYLMASLDHPNLLPLLAVCMTSRMMLVTQLMPLGCLLDYVRQNRHTIGSKSLLNWCAQIARGMAHLEQCRLVHRDLAARNVLVQTPHLLKITDFGLARLLESGEEEYRAAGGRMPLKWLALECIQHRIFNHKSDVWAFGVTVWELLTYGGRPYEDVPAKDVPDLLEKGERLPQPSCCSIEVYMLMIKCWMLDAESRPSFSELTEQFSKMAQDPGRYLIIPGDRLMKLPSYTQQDERDMVRRLAASALDNPASDVVLMASEYLASGTDSSCSTADVSHYSPADGSTNAATEATVVRPCGAHLQSKSNCGSNETRAHPHRNGSCKRQNRRLPLDDQQYLMPALTDGPSSIRSQFGVTEILNPEYMGSAALPTPASSNSPKGHTESEDRLSESTAGTASRNRSSVLSAANSVGVPICPQKAPHHPHPRVRRTASDHVTYYNDISTRPTKTKVTTTFSCNGSAAAPTSSPPRSLQTVDIVSVRDSETNV